MPNQDGRVDLSGSPTVTKFRAKLSEDHSDEEFVTSLETLLDRLEMDVSQ